MAESQNKKHFDIDFGTSGESIAQEFMMMGYADPESVTISKSSFKLLSDAIESYASFRIGVENAGEDI